MFLLGLALSIAGGLTAFLFAGFGNRSFCRLVEYQFSHHRDKWVESGRPIGGRATRANAAFWTSNAATLACLVAWSIERPDWLPEESEGEAYRKEANRSFAIAFAVGFPAFWVGLLLLHLSGR